MAKQSQILSERGLTPEMLDENGLPRFSFVFERIARDHDIDNAAIGKRLRLSPTSVGRLRRGEVTYMQPTNLLRLCEQFNLPLRPFLLANLVNQLPEAARERGAKALLDGSSAIPVLQRLSDIPVATHIRVDYQTWRSARTHKRNISDVVFEHAIARPGREFMRTVPETWDQSFVFRHTGTRMMGANDEPLSIPHGAMVLIQPIPEDTIQNGDFVLVQFFNDPTNQADQPEDAGIYRYLRRTQNDAVWEEYQSLDTRHPVRLRDPGKFNERPIETTRAILGKAVAIVYGQLEVS